MSEGDRHSDARLRILHGKLPLEVLRFGAPLALGMGLQTTFNLVDAYLISRLPPEVSGPALGAIGICDQLAALGTIVSAAKGTREKGGWLRLVAPTNAVRRALRITQIDTVLGLYDTVDQAVAHVEDAPV